MTREDHVLALFAGANPVPDAETLLDDQETLARLVAVEQRSTDMEDNLRSIEEAPQVPARRGWLIAAAAVVVLIAGLGVMALTSGEQNGSIPVSGIDGDPAAAEAFTVIEAAYAAYNAGELYAWAVARDAGSLGFTGEPIGGLAGLQGDHAALYAAGDRYEVAQCVSHGFGDWPGITDSGDPATGYRFTCKATSTNSFYGAGGIVLAEDYEWVVADGKSVAARSDGDYAPLAGFNKDFRQWLQDNHPEIAAGMQYWRGNGFPNRQDVATALEYVDQFVEDSPDWPLPSSP
jgi:hypothetical protein